MSERSGPESRQRRRPGWFAYLVWPAPLVPGALVLGALALTRWIDCWPYWCGWRWRHALTILVALSVLAVAAWSLIASAYPRRMARVLAHFREGRRRIPQITRASVLEAVEQACTREAAILKNKGDRLVMLARLILLLATLGFALSAVDSYAQITAGGCSSFTMNDGLIFALTPLATALAFVIPLVVLHALLRGRQRNLLAEVRAIARVLAEHAAERAAAKKK